VPATGGTKSTSSSIARSLFIVALLLSLAFTVCSQLPALAQTDYTYLAFHTEMKINANGSLLVRNKVTYEFPASSRLVGLFVPSFYGRLVEGRVLGGDGTVLPDGTWGLSEDERGYSFWCDTGATGTVATCIYEYLLDDAFVRDAERTGLEKWTAVPADRNSPITESSVRIRFPAEADAASIKLTVTPLDYRGRISQRFEGGDTAVIEAADLAEASSYSITCYWPSSLMDTTVPDSPPGEEKSWEFERFDSEITVNPDSSFTVRETQVVNFRGSFEWLNRDISTESAFSFNGRTYGRVRIHDIAVFTLDGQPYDRGHWGVESYDSGKRVHIEFEARDEQKGWIIEYRMTGAFIFADDLDRLYWDAVSIDRDVAIKSSTVTVQLPQGIKVEDVKASEYIDISNPPSDYGQVVEGDRLRWEVREIPPYSTFTIDVALPKGAVAKPWQYDRACGIAIIASSSFLLAAAALGMFLLWWRKGRDVGRTGTAMVRYEPPVGILPAMLGMLVNQKPRVHDISATIVDLARRGYLVIIESEKRSFIRMREYAFQRSKEDLSGLLPYEREIMEGLFSSGDRVEESDLRNKFYTHVDSILNKGVKKEVMERKLFTTEPGAMRTRYLVAAALVAGLPLAALLVLPTWFDLGWFAVLLLAFIPIGAVVAIVGWAMPSRSVEGSRAYEHAMGFREFMETAEKQELESMTPENFQANLPYAMVLGVADAWARKFKDIYTTPPEWYASSGATFSTLYLASSLNGMTDRMNSTLTSSPRSSGSGGGGFGGGSAGGRWRRIFGRLSAPCVSAFSFRATWGARRQSACSCPWGCSWGCSWEWLCG